MTVSGGSRLNVSDSGNERNDFAISFDGGAAVYRVHDAAGIDANGPCSPIDPETATCPATGIGSITVNAGSGSDQAGLDPATIPLTVEADLNGGRGNDRLFGSGAADALDGDSGTDILDGGPGADDLRGGSNADVLSYTGRTETLFVTIGSGEDDDGGPLDQTASRRDTVRGDVEQVLGGGPDTFFGDGSDDTLVGGGQRSPLRAPRRRLPGRRTELRPPLGRARPGPAARGRSRRRPARRPPGGPPLGRRR